MRSRSLHVLALCASIISLQSLALAQDCDKDGVADPNAIAQGLVPDCNGNVVPDYCDIWIDFTSNDCNNNGIPDDCETDCNKNAIPDDCDIAQGGMADCDGNRIPDMCEVGFDDCNANGQPDACDLRGSIGFDQETYQFAIDHDGFALNPIDVVVGDMNGDDRPDIVSANRSFPLGLSVAVWIAQNDGTFAPGVTYNAGVDAEGVAVGDFDNDDDLDVVVTVRRSNFSQNGVEIFRNNGDGTLTQHAALVVGSYLIDAVSADFNGDSLDDIALADINGARVAVLLATGGANFAAAAYYNVGSRPIYVSVADLDGDDDLDLAASVQGNGGSIAVLANNGSGAFSTLATLNVPDNEGGNEVEAVDVDGDTDADLVLIQQSYKRIATYLNDGSGVFATPIVSQGPADNHVAMTTGDYDNDGLLDVAISTSSGFFPNGDFRPGLGCVMRGNGDGTFLGPKCDVVGDSPLSIASGDFDLDGQLDLAIGVYQFELLRVLKNRTVDAVSDDVNNSGVPDECECIGDLNGDLSINLTDLAILLANFGGPGSAAQGDLNGDSEVELVDLAILLARFGSVCS